MMEEFMQEEKKLHGDFGNDPIAALRSRELDLKLGKMLGKDKKDKIELT
jgi:hypothetical protein